MIEKKAKPKSRLPVYIGSGVLLLVIAGFLLVRSFLSKPVPQTKKVVQEVQIVRPPPPPENTPPPPPPPPKEEVKLAEPQQAPDPTPSNQPPPGESLGVDADGSGSGDGFGLVGRKGGRDLVGGGGSAFAWYSGIIKGEIQEKLSNDPKVRTGSFSVAVRIWLRLDGTVDNIRLMASTGNAERDRAIESALGSIRRLSQPPPAGMPQPVTLRIVSRT